MKKVITITLATFLSLGFVFGHSNDTIDVPLGTSPTIDGVFNIGEWDDALSVQLPSIDATVFFKRTDTHLYIAFTDWNQMYSNSSGIYIDKLHDGGTVPNEDDLWLHGSAGQYESFGNNTTWESSTPSGWSYVRDTENEYEISLSKLGITSNTSTTLGVLFSFWDWSVDNSEITWPSGGFANCGNPESWANMNISFTSEVSENHDQKNEISIFPNPTNSSAIISFSNPKNENHSLLIRNIKGQLVQKIENITDRDIKIESGNLESGMYFIELQNNSGIVGRNKIIIQ